MNRKQDYIIKYVAFPIVKDDILFAYAPAKCYITAAAGSFINGQKKMVYRAVCPWDCFTKQTNIQPVFNKPKTKFFNFNVGEIREIGGACANSARVEEVFDDYVTCRYVAEEMNDQLIELKAKEQQLRINLPIKVLEAKYRESVEHFVDIATELEEQNTLEVNNII